MEGIFSFLKEPKKKPESPSREEMKARRETQISEFLDTSKKINFKIAQLRYLTYNPAVNANDDVKNQAQFAASLLRSVEVNYAKDQGITIDRESFNWLGEIVKYDPEQYDTFTGEIKPGDEVVIVQPSVIGNRNILGYYDQTIRKPQVCSVEYFSQSNLEEIKVYLRSRQADRLTELWG